MPEKIKKKPCHKNKKERANGSEIDDQRAPDAIGS